MVTAEAPADYEGKWHDYEISVVNGLITAYIDGEKIFEHTDTSNPSGTIGFDGINVAYYVDDIEVTTSKTAAPTADVAEGSYDQPQTVHLTAEGADIYYTLDGSSPIENGTLYNAANGIQISGNVTLKCVAKAAGMRYSDVVELSYQTPSAYSRENLQKLYDENKDRDLSGYTQSSRDAFTAAMDKAEKVLDKSEAAPDEIENAIVELQNAIAHLSKGAVIKGWLSTLYYENRNREQGYYTEESWAVFQEALDAAKAALEDPDTDQETIDTVKAALQEAVDGLERGEGPKPPTDVKEQFFSEDFEDESATVWTKGGNKSIESSVVADPDNSDNQILQIDATDGVLYFNDPEAVELRDYVYEFKIRLKEWNGPEEWTWAYIAPSFYVTPDDLPAMARYALKYEKTSGEFALFNGAVNSNIVSTAAPQDYNAYEWHQFKIDVQDGTVTAYLDGGEEPVFQYTDQSFVRGTFGFEAIGASFYVDDINVTLRNTADPAADKESGTYEEDFEVTLSAGDDTADIFYTLDGSDPRENGTYYFKGEPLTIDKSCTLKVVAIAEGRNYSNVVEYNYTMAGDPADPEDPELTAVREILQRTVDYAKTLDTTGAVESAVEYFNKTLQAAEDLLAKEDAAKEELMDAWNDLLDGIWGLGIVQGDKTLLKILIDKADSMIPNEDKYVAEYWPQLVETLEKAKEVYENGDALEEDVQAAEEALLEAVTMQRYKADKSNLEDLIQKAESMDLSVYTKESVSVLERVLAEARVVLEDGNLSVDDQDKVDQAAKELNDAISSLVKLSSDGEEQGGNGSDDNGSTESGDSGNNAGNADSGKDGGSGGDSPQTGDNTSADVWVIAVLLAGAAGLTAVLRFRKRRS